MYVLHTSNHVSDNIVVMSICGKHYDAPNNLCLRFLVCMFIGVTNRFQDVSAVLVREANNAVISLPGSSLQVAVCANVSSVSSTLITHIKDTN